MEFVQSFTEKVILFILVRKLRDYGVSILVLNKIIFHKLKKYFILISYSLILNEFIIDFIFDKFKKGFSNLDFLIY